MQRIFLRSVGIGALLLLAVLVGSVTSAEEATDRVVEIEGQVERAAGPADLLGLAAGDAVTVRALRAFGRLPEPYMELALALRRDGIDLLTMGPGELRELIVSAQAGQVRVDPERVAELLALIDDREYLEWEALAAGDSLVLGDQDLLRGDGRVVIERASGETLALRTSGLVLPAAVAREVDRRQWADAPAMRFYEPFLSARAGRVEAWERLAAVVATPDGGYLVAGSVAGSGNYEIRLLRHGPEGDLQWVRRLSGAGIDWLLRSAVVDAEGRILLAGDHGRLGAGFVVALDPDGAVLWTRIARGPDDAQMPEDAQFTYTEGLVDLAVNDRGEILAVGWRRAGGAQEAQAVVRALAADGEPLWSHAFESAAELRVVSALDTGWLVGGVAAASPGQSWVAGLDTAGTIQWQADDAGLMRPPEAAASQGDTVVLAARGTVPGTVVLRSFAADGAVSGIREAAVRQAGYPLVDSIGALALDADGGTWLAGQALDGHAWVARLNPDGELDWLQEFGGEGEQALAGLLPRGEALVAVGSDRLEPTRADGHALWVVTMDGSGALVPEHALSESAMALSEELEIWLEIVEDMGFIELGGYPEFVELEDGTIIAQLPFLAVEMPWSFPGLGTRHGELDLELVQVSMRPLDHSERWQLQLELPSVLAMRHPRSGQVIGRIETGGKPMDALWAGDLLTVLQADLDLGAVQFTVAPDDPLARHTSVPGASAARPAYYRNEVGQFNAERVRLHLDLDETRPGVVTGPLVLEATGITQTTRGGQAMGGLQRVFLEADYQDIDLATFSELARLADDPERAMEMGPDQLFEQTLETLGAFEIRIGLREFEFLEPGGEGRVSLGQATFGTRFDRQDPEHPERSLRKWLEVEDGFAEHAGDGLDMRLESLRAGFSLEGISPSAVMTLGMGAMMSGGLDAEIARGALGDVLSGLRVELKVAGARSRLPDDEQDIVAMMLRAVDLEAFDFDFQLDGLNTEAPDLALRYLHRLHAEWPPGLLPMDEALFPQEVVIDIVGSGLPAALAQDDEALFELQYGGGGPLQALARVLSEHQSRLEIREIVIDLPLGGLRATAEGGTREQDGMEILWSESTIVIRNLEALGDAILALAPTEADRQEALGVLTILKLAGERQQNEAGETEHVFRIVADSAGELTLNGTDLGQLLSGAQGR